MVQGPTFSLSLTTLQGHGNSRQGMTTKSDLLEGVKNVFTGLL